EAHGIAHGSIFGKEAHPGTEGVAFPRGAGRRSHRYGAEPQGTESREMLGEFVSSRGQHDRAGQGEGDAAVMEADGPFQSGRRPAAGRNRVGKSGESGEQVMAGFRIRHQDFSGLEHPIAQSTPIIVVDDPLAALFYFESVRHVSRVVVAEDYKVINPPAQVRMASGWGSAFLLLCWERPVPMGAGFPFTSARQRKWPKSRKPRKPPTPSPSGSIWTARWFPPAPDPIRMPNRPRPIPSPAACSNCPM